MNLGEQKPCIRVRCNCVSSGIMKTKWSCLKRMSAPLRFFTSWRKVSVCSRSCYSVKILCSSTVNDPHCLRRLLFYTLTHFTPLTHHRYTHTKAGAHTPTQAKHTHTHTQIHTYIHTCTYSAPRSNSYDPRGPSIEQAFPR